MSLYCVLKHTIVYDEYCRFPILRDSLRLIKNLQYYQKGIKDNEIDILIKFYVDTALK